MEYNHLALIFTACAVGIMTFYGILKRVNGWYYAIKFCSKKYNIPPGDMGWPLIGNTLHYFKSSLSGDANSFLSYFATRYICYVVPTFLEMSLYCMSNLPDVV